MPVWIVVRRIAAAGFEGGGGGASACCCCPCGEAETFCSAVASSRRMAAHSMALRLLCWKRSISGVDSRSEAYWRKSCDLRSSGGLYDGGCVRGKRSIIAAEEE